MPKIGTGGVPGTLLKANKVSQFVFDTLENVEISLPGPLKYALDLIDILDRCE